MSVSGLIVMGVSGSGKTTVGKALAARLGWEFFDGDDFHPAANKSKMAAGVPLEDADRAPWLETLHAKLETVLGEGRHPVLACSALKARYRDQLLRGNAGVRVVYLKGSFDLIQARMAERADHYMKPGMLQSQFEALEEPADALVADISVQPEAIAETVCRRLGLSEVGKNGME
jgi:gluconokinase